MTSNQGRRQGRRGTIKNVISRLSRGRDNPLARLLGKEELPTCLDCSVPSRRERAGTIGVGSCLPACKIPAHQRRAIWLCLTNLEFLRSNCPSAPSLRGLPGAFSSLFFCSRLQYFAVFFSLLHLTPHFFPRAAIARHVLIGASHLTKKRTRQHWPHRR